MTRNGSWTFGSLARNFKRALVLSAFLFSGSYVNAASETNYKMRIHKNFIKELMDKNFEVVLAHVESKIS